MELLYLSEHAKLNCHERRRAANASMLGFFMAVALALCAYTQPLSAQDADSEAAEPVTAEDVADGVEAVNAIKSDKQKVKTYCSALDVIDDTEGEDGSTTVTDPKAEEALDAKVEKIINSLGEDFSDAFFTLDELAEGAAIGKPLVAAFEELDKLCDN